jgi:hypothetical protein
MLVLAGRGTAAAEVFVQPFPGQGSRIQVSTKGGSQPQWSSDGRQLFFMTPDRKLMVVDVRNNAGVLAVSKPRVLFQTRITAPNYALFQYDVTSDGKRFLINSLPADSASPLTLLINWNTGFR